MALSPCRARILRTKTPQLLATCLRSRTYTTTTDPSASSPSNVARWSQTPPAMKAKVAMDFARDPRNKVWSVNNSPDRLDEMYDRLLGPGGAKLLPEELKWLAVTHKSFDQGRRGFNHKLSVLGRAAIAVEATKITIAKQALPGASNPDKFGRTPVDDAQLRALDNLNVEGFKDVFDDARVYSLCNDIGLLDVVRWKPRLPDNLEASGVGGVMNNTLCAIVGAITLQHGSAVANKVIQDKILARMAAH